MEKLFKSMMAVAIAAFTFAACDDVPEPYNNPYNGIVIVPEVQDADPEGTGTQTDPFNVAAALAKCKEAGETATSEEFYCKGYVTTITEISAQFGNATFKIADSKEGGTELTVYRAKGPGKADVKDENLVKLGDEVVICGKLVNFKSNTPEFTQGCYIVSINGKGGGEETTTETIGTKEAPKTVADVLTVINGLENNKTTDDIYIVKGKVKQVISSDANITQYKNIDYLITDDGTNEIKVFRGKYLDNADFTVDNKVKVDDVVIIRGKLQKYEKDGTVTPEIVDNYIIDLNGEGGTTPTPTPTGDNLLTNGDFETWEGSLPTNWKTASSAGNATLSQSTDKHNGTYAVQIAGATTNKRMAYKETVYKAGTYTLKFYAKAATADGGSVTAGYVPVTEGQSINASDYKYGDIIELTNTEWKEVTYQFTLDADTRLSVYVRMNKVSGKDILVDDVELFGAGIADGGEGEGGEGGGSTPSGDLGTAEAPITIAKALEVINTLSNGGTTDDEAFVKGKISKIKGYYSSKYITYYISDTGEESNELQIYNGVGINGADFTAKEDLSVGQTVVVKGKLMKYVKNDVVTPEINGGVLVSKE